MKNCQSIGKKITAYLCGELNERDIQALEAHLETCESCRDELEARRATLSSVGSHARNRSRAGTAQPVAKACYSPSQPPGKNLV